MYLVWTLGLGATNRIIDIFIGNYNITGILNAALFQIFITILAGYNIYNGSNNYIDNSVIGYYIYDTIYLLSYNQYAYIVHHVFALYLIYLHITYQIAPFFYSNVMYFLMELSACMLNWMNLLGEYKIQNYRFKVLTYSVYTVTRVITYPIFLIDYIQIFYEPIWYHNVHLAINCMIYIISIGYLIISVKKLT